jgi:hypothetical protein
MECIECCQGKLVRNQELGSLMSAAQGCLGPGRWSQANVADWASTGVHSCETVALRKGELHVVEASKHCRISCTAGTVWVTSSNRASDYILNAGECVLLQGQGKILISGNGKNCQVRISRS